MTKKYGQANTVQRFYKAVLPDPAAREFAAQVTPVEVIADKIRALTPPADISQVMQQVDALLDRSIATEGYLSRVSPVIFRRLWVLGGLFRSSGSIRPGVSENTPWAKPRRATSSSCPRDAWP
jgi:hypothetical protein